MAKLENSGFGKSSSSNEDEAMNIDIDYYVMAISALVKLSAVRRQLKYCTNATYMYMHVYMYMGTVLVLYMYCAQ